MSLFDYATGEPDVEFDGERACIICGCSDNRACEGGCSWKSVDPPVCSNCCGVAAAECFPTVTASWNPCPLESDHDGNHVFWQQTVRDGNKRKKNGVRVIDSEGKVLCMADFRGAVGPAEVAALVAVSTRKAGS